MIGIAYHTRCSPKRGLHKGEEGFLAAPEMTESNRRKSGRPPADPLFYCRSNTRRFGSVRPAVWTVVVKVLPPIGEVNSPLLSTYAISVALLTFTLTSAI